MEVCLARGTLILPVWKSSFFWNVCATDGVHWSRFAVDWVYLLKFQGLFVKGKARNYLFGTRPLDFDVVALRVDFRRPRAPLCHGGFCTLPYGKCDLLLDAILIELLYALAWATYDVLMKTIMLSHGGAILFMQ